MKDYNWFEYWTLSSSLIFDYGSREVRFYWINGSFKPFNHTAGCCSLYDDSLAGAGAVYEFPVLVPVAVLVRSESTGDLGTGASFNFGAGQSLPVLVLVPVPVIVYRWLGCCFRSTGLGSDSSESLHAPRAPLPVRVLSCRIRCRCDRLMWRLSVWASAGFEVRVKIRMSRWVPMVWNDY